MTLMGLYGLAEQHNIRVDTFCLNRLEALSIEDADGDRFIAIDPFQIRSYADEKTKLAHELGHCETGSFYNVQCLDSLRGSNENRADKWAIRNVIPKEELDKAVASGCTEPWELADHFRVTEEFMRKAIRWYTCGNLCVENPN